jgi:hypothetical protein
MLNLKDKIIFFQSYLKVEENYADTFKADITMFFDDDFSVENSQLQFLRTLNTEQEIKNWVDKLTSRFVMKFDSELESEDDFIYDYLENG